MESLRQNNSDSDKDWWMVMILSLCFGWLGVDRFYLSQPVMACLKLFTFGGAGIWWAIDLLLLLFNRMRDGYGGLVRRPF